MGRSNYTQRTRAASALPTSTATATPNEAGCAYGYPADPSYYVVLPPAPYDPARRRRGYLGYGALFILAALLISAALYFFWPSQPSIQIARLNLNNISFQTSPQPGSIIPHLFMNISMGMTLKVKNRDYFGLDYDYLKVGIGYRGRTIGWVHSQGGHLAARHAAYVDATLDLDGIEVLNDVFYLLKDIDRGHLPLDTVTEFDGRLGLLFTKISLQEVVSCEVVVNPSKQTIVSQDCDLL
ncbi:hypothetical protein KI387_026571, partial [Taxus chinensis]